MKEIAARDAKNQFGRLIDAAQAEPVRVTKQGRPVGVFMSEAQYERLRGAAWQRLRDTVEAMREEASRNGLSEEALADLLRDES